MGILFPGGHPPHHIRVRQRGIQLRVFKFQLFPERLARCNHADLYPVLQWRKRRWVCNLLQRHECPELHRCIGVYFWSPDVYGNDFRSDVVTGTIHFGSRVRCELGCFRLGKYYRADHRHSRTLGFTDARRRALGIWRATPSILVQITPFVPKQSKQTIPLSQYVSWK
jgi:hypothetical protein